MITPLNPNQFYSKATGDLNLLASWGSNLDGSGSQPASFSEPNQIFNIRNSTTKTISANWTINGFGSKAVLDNTGNPITFTIPAGSAMQGNLDLQANARLNIASLAAPALGLIAPSSTVTFSNGNQTIPGNAYGNLIIDGGGTKTLNGQTTVNGTLTLTRGTIDLDDYNLQLFSNSINGFSSSNYIITSGLGSLRRTIPRGGSVFFPVGTATGYSPVTIALTASSTEDNFFVSVLPALYSDLDEDFQPIGPAVTSRVVARTWVIAEEVEGGSNATVSLQWGGADEQPNFNRALSNIATYVNSNWVTTAAGPASGSNPYTRSLSAITSFGAFAVAGENAVLNPAPLPVRLLMFSAEAKNHQVLLSWQTTLEEKNDRFEIQRSTDTKTWETIGSVKSKGNHSGTQSYSFTDHVLPGTDQLYYRLQQLDTDGTFSFSPIRTVTLRPQKPTAAIFENPFQDALRFKAQTSEFAMSEIRLYNALGRLVFSTRLSGKSAAGTIALPTLPAGLYSYQLLNNQQLTGSGKLIKLR